MQVQLAEAQMVKMYAKRIAEEVELELPSPKNFPVIAYERTLAAASCANTIITGCCPFFIYVDDGRSQTIQRRPPEFKGFGGLKSVK
jgi:hypothetical protein